MSDPVVMKRSAPLLAKIRELSLRRGDSGLRDLCRLFRKDRVGPEEFKSEMLAFGIALTATDNELIFQAFKDAIGYLLVTPFFDAVVNVVPPVVADAVAAVFAALGPLTLPPLHPKRPDPKPRVAVKLSALQACAEEQDTLLDVFNAKMYSDGFVPELEFRAYYAGLYSYAIRTGLSDGAFAELIRSQWKAVVRHSDDAASAASVKLSAFGATAADSLKAAPDCSSLCGTLVATALPHKAKFVEERDAIDMPSRVVGYQGHLPTAQEQFGLTFHRIEAALPPFHRPDPADEGPARPAAVDMQHAFVRQGNKANHHNFRFA